MITLLPIALAALAGGTHVLAARILPAPRPARDRACATALLAPLVAIATVLALSALGAIAPWPMRLATLLATALLVALGGRDARATARDDARRALTVVRGAFTGPWALTALVGLAALGGALAATWLLPPWAWDALGYHLPVVYDALQVRHLRDVPTGVIFVNAYPHAGDWFVIWWRAWLPDDTWIELSQAPFAALAVVAIASLAARAGVASKRALALAAGFVALPVVALQLASNYVDITYAAVLLAAVYFATSALTAAELVLTGVALGLLLAVKPSAPPAALLLASVTAARAARSRPPAWSIALALLAVAAGCERYALNAYVHHNPIWPVQLQLGPLTLPGLHDARVYIEQGVSPAFLRHGRLMRLIRSGYAQPDHYVYDMRIGGLGPLFQWALVPLALVACGRRRARRVALPVALAAACALTTPGAFAMRYALTLPAALLALAMVVTDDLSPRARAGLDLVLGALAAWGLALAWPGFTLSGPSLWAVRAMSPAQRAVAVDIDGDARDWPRARALVGDGDAFGCDASVELTGQLWRGDGRGRIAWLTGATPDAAALRAWAVRERVRVAALGDAGAGAVARAQPEWFTPLFHCHASPCTVYRVERRGEATGGVLVLAPHPDDEVLMAAGVLRAAVLRGEPVSVIVLTNGDAACAPDRDGFVRERESVAALASLGVRERDVHFLGYPDGRLAALGEHALAPAARRDDRGGCVLAAATYAAYGAGSVDEHTARTGAAAPYTADALTGDLAALLARLRPRDIYVTHALDEHPDHAMAYAFLRRALERAHAATPVTVHRAILHAGACWPGALGSPCPAVQLDLTSPMPPLPEPFARYLPTERVPLPASMGDGKFAAIARYRSQTGPDPAHDWLATFARADEVFHPEILVDDPRAPGRLIRATTRATRCTATLGPGATLRMLADDDDDPRGGYALAVRDGARLVVSRGDGAVLRALALPADAGTHTYELRVDARADEGGVVELTVRRDGEVLLVAVDPAPVAQGTRASVATRGNAASTTPACADEP